MKKIILSIILTCIAAVCLAEEQKDSVKVVKGKKDSVKVFDRGIGMSSSVFIPKGSIGSGLSFTYNDINVGNAANDAGYSMLFSLLNGTKGSMTTFGVAPFVSYFIADNLSVGVRFDYDRTRLNIGHAGLSIMEGMEFSIDDMNYFKHMYSGALAGRYYMPFGTSKRFAMFAEVRLTGAYGQSEQFTFEGDKKYGTYQDITKLSISLVPGLTAFVTNEVALEVSVGILGFDYQHVKQITNQVEVSEMTTSGANYNINLLSINMGISFYVPMQNKLKKS